MGHSIVWFRRDLRLIDNPALHAAIAHAAEVGDTLTALFIHAPEEEDPWRTQGAAQVWLHHSLLNLEKLLRDRGSKLIVRRGGSLEMLREVAKECGAKKVFWNRLYEPASIRRDSEIKTALRTFGIEAESFNGALLREPWEIQTKTGGPYQVYTPFWRALSATFEPRRDLPRPSRLPVPSSAVRSQTIDDLKLLPSIPWDRSMMDYWEVGEEAAISKVKKLLSSKIEAYKESRDVPSLEGTSKLSPHLHFGEIGPNQIWNLVVESVGDKNGAVRSAGAEHFLKELAWREFAHHLLFHFPTTPEEPLRVKFAKFPWKNDPDALRRWQRGLTGYPIVDAGMRELWATGWMHNRVRMIVASFLVKDLLLPWQEGAKWFWDTLVDASLANNTLGWQWAAGCGADAAPYFRIFNPQSQSEKFDSDGAYIRRWIPELEKLQAPYIHNPSQAPRAALEQAGVVIGETYPSPIVDHSEARDLALEALSSLKIAAAD